MFRPFLVHHQASHKNIKLILELSYFNMDLYLSIWFCFLESEYTFVKCNITMHTKTVLFLLLLLQSDTNSACDWCAATSMRLNTAKMRVVSYSRNKNVPSYEYELCHVAITRTSSINDLCVFFDSIQHFHNRDFLFSECINLLGLIRSFRFSSLDFLYVLYFMLVRYKLEYASVVRNSVTSTDANRLSSYLKLLIMFKAQCYVLSSWFLLVHFFYINVFSFSSAFL
jgi:hypothetical protein